MDRQIFCDQVAADVEGMIARTIDQVEIGYKSAEKTGQLINALRYSSLGGGKRIRPCFVMAGATLFDLDRSQGLRCALAVEMIHCYSLVHDDLPAMDDDTLRRGQPTCHIFYDEATAILAGDALLTLAFQVLSDKLTHPNAQVRCDLIQALALASGAEGMVGGQMCDLLAEQKEWSIEDITRLQNLKTGALLRFSCVAPALLAQANAQDQAALESYARDVGLAFQIADDILDVVASSDQLGKVAGKDADAGKATVVGLLGVDGARQKARDLVARAQNRLACFGARADRLCQLADYVVERER